MRNKVIVGIALVAVFVLGVLCVRAWDHYEVSQRVATQVNQYQDQQKAEEAARAETKRQQAEAREKLLLKEECQEGLKAYNALTPAQKTTKEKPNCDLEQIE